MGGFLGLSSSSFSIELGLDLVLDGGQLKEMKFKGVQQWSGGGWDLGD